MWTQQNYQITKDWETTPVGYPKGCPTLRWRSMMMLRRAQGRPHVRPGAEPQEHVSRSAISGQLARCTERTIAQKLMGAAACSTTISDLASS